MARPLESGYLRRYKAGRSYSYVCDNRGFDLLGHRDRVKVQRPRKNSRRSKGPEERGLSAHDRGLMDPKGSFYDAGLTGTNGARSWEHRGNAGIAPAGLVYLLSSPYGPGWHYVKYEIRARSSQQAEAKMSGHASSRRQDGFPILAGQQRRNDGLISSPFARGQEGSSMPGNQDHCGYSSIQRFRTARWCCSLPADFGLREGRRRCRLAFRRSLRVMAQDRRAVT